MRQGSGGVGVGVGWVGMGWEWVKGRGGMSEVREWGCMREGVVCGMGDIHFLLVEKLDNMEENMKL
jgi:hypothetical protein